MSNLELEERSEVSEAAVYWQAVRRIIEMRLDDVAGLSAHALGPLAADILEPRSMPVPLPYLHQQRIARVSALMAPALLGRIRDACDGPILLLKGPEAAARYPRRSRAFGDLDLLVPDAEEVQRALLDAGFVEEEDPEGIWVGIHHLTPLRWPGMPLKVEIHSELKWPEGIAAPRNEELFEGAVASAAGVSGILAPAASQHALVVAAHAWAHKPLGKARDLFDVGAFALEADSGELSRLARAWGLVPLWHTTTAALEALLGCRRTWPLRLWATHLSTLSLQTVLEEHLERSLSPYWGLPPRTAARRSASAFIDQFRPGVDEGWREKAARSATALRRPFTPVARHRDMLGESASRKRRTKTPPRSP